MRVISCYKKRLGRRVFVRFFSPAPSCIDDVQSELDRIDRDGVHTAPTMYISLLRRCVDLSQAKRVHRHIVSSEHREDRLLLNMLIQLYGKCGSIENARDVFERIVDRNVFTWTMMIAAYAQYGHNDLALQLFHKMLLDGAKPDKVGFLKVLEVCSTITQVQEVHALILEAGLERVTCLGNALVNMHGKGGYLEEAEMIFQRMLSKDVVSWNTMVTVYAQFCKGEKALELFKRMQEEDIKPDRVTYISVLEACSSMDSLEHGEKIHAQVVADGLDTDIIVTNSLMNMYGDRGALDKARDVFEGMKQRDVVSWNAIIRAYTQHGHNKHALQMFRRMHLECMIPNEVTFVSILGAAEAVSELKVIHEGLIAAGFDSNVLVGNSLVHMHGKCGNLDDAKQLFDGMLQRNVSSWNSIVDAYANNGLELEAFCLFRRMQLEGFKPDKVTFLTVLDVCSTLSQGRHIQQQIVARGLQFDVLLQTALVQMYTKTGSLKEARDVFDGIKNRDLFAWNSLLHALAQGGAGEKAVDMFQRMNFEGVKAGEQTFVSLLDSCASLGEIDQGVRIHACADECGLVKTSLSVGNTLINMYGKCDRLDEAKSIFDQMQGKNIISWNALIAAYVQHGRLADTAFHLLGLMQQEGTRPDRITFFSCLDACSDLEQVRRVHRQISTTGLDRDVAVANSLINIYRKSQNFEAAEQVFESMHGNKDVVSWTSMISVYVDAGSGKQAVKMCEQMHQHGDKPDSITFSRMLEAHGSLGCLRRGRTVHEQVKQSGYETDPFVLPSLIGMYSACNSLGDALQVYESVRAEDRDVLLCNAMLAAFSVQGYGRKCVELFRLMDCEGLSPNRATFNTILDACACSAGLLQARVIHSSIVSSGFISDVTLDNTLINMYGKCGSLRDARRVFESMEDRALVSWNSIIAVTAQHGEEAEARKLFRQLQQEGMKPDNVALMSVASACQHVGLLEEAFFYLFQLAKEYGVKPSRERYSCIVGLLGRIGWLEEAEYVIRKMPFEPNEAVWKNLLISCKLHEDVARGARVAKELWQLDSDDPATYVTLYNMYAEKIKTL